ETLGCWWSFWRIQASLVLLPAALVWHCFLRIIRFSMHKHKHHWHLFCSQRA
ncbi:unnamed protein product, partial [Linum tenue]